MWTFQISKSYIIKFSQHHCLALHFSSHYAVFNLTALTINFPTELLSRYSRYMLHIMEYSIPIRRIRMHCIYIYCAVNLSKRYIIKSDKWLVQLFVSYFVYHWHISSSVIRRKVTIAKFRRVHEQTPNLF